jgi:hypothetical protein
MIEPTEHLDLRPDYSTGVGWDCKRMLDEMRFKVSNPLARVMAQPHNMIYFRIDDWEALSKNRIVAR